MRDETRDMYPAFKHVEEHMRPTPVHLQVFDGTSALYIARRTVPDRIPLLRRSSRSSCSLPIHNAWQILLPRCGLVLQARYGRATGAAKPYGPQLQYFPDVSHAPE